MPGISNYGEGLYGAGRYSYNPNVYMTANATFAFTFAGIVQRVKKLDAAFSASFGFAADLQRVKPLDGTMGLTLGFTGTPSSIIALFPASDMVISFDFVADMADDVFWVPTPPATGPWAGSAVAAGMWTPVNIPDMELN